MAAGAKFRLVRHGDRSGAEHDRSGHATQYKDDTRLPAHALIEHDGGTAS